MMFVVTKKKQSKSGCIKKKIWKNRSNEKNPKIAKILINCKKCENMLNQAGTAFFPVFKSPQRGGDGQNIYP